MGWACYPQAQRPYTSLPYHYYYSQYSVYLHRTIDSPLEQSDGLHEGKKRLMAHGSWLMAHAVCCPKLSTYPLYQLSPKMPYSHWLNPEALPQTLCSFALFARPVPTPTTVIYYILLYSCSLKIPRALLHFLLDGQRGSIWFQRRIAQHCHVDDIKRPDQRVW